MATETLRLGGEDVDHDLDFEDFDSDFGLDQKAVKKDRNPVISVIKGAVEGVKSKFTDPSFLGEIVSDSLPDEYGRIKNTVGDVAKSVVALHDETVRELKPIAGKIATRIDKLVPDNFKRLKKATTGAKAFFSENTFGRADSNESRQDQSIAMAMSDVFGVQATQQQEMAARAEARDDVRSAIEDKRFKTSAAHLLAIDTNLSRLTQYNQNVNTKFQQKSLELQFRSYFAQAEQLDVLKRYLETFKVQFEGISKNTALPDYVKYTTKEHTGEFVKRKFMESASSLFGGEDVIKQGMARLGKKAKDTVGGLKFGLEASDDAIAAMQDAREMMAGAEADGMDVDRKEMISSMLFGAAISNKIKKKITGFAKDKIDDNGKLAKGLYRGANIAADLPSFLATLNKSDFVQNNEYGTGPKSWLAKGIGTVSEAFGRGGPDVTLADNQNALLGDSEAGMFNKRTNSTITDIIPGYLSRILREITVLRTGDNKTPLTSFNQRTGKFVTSRELTADIKKTIQDSAKSSSYSYALERANRGLDDNMGDEEKADLTSLFETLSQKGFTADTVEKYRNSQVYKQLPDKQRRIFDKILDKIEGGENSEKDLLAFNDKVRDVRKAIPDVRKTIADYFDSGHKEDLVKQGIVKIENGTARIDEKEMYRIISEANKSAPGTANYPSDINVKEDITPANKEGLLDRFKKLSVFNWKYKKGKGDEGYHEGPMAQDVQDKLGDDTAPGGTKIDIASMNGKMIGAIQELDDKIDGMKPNKQLMTYLKLLHQNTGFMVEELRKQTKISVDFSNMFGGLADQAGKLKAKAAGVINAGKDKAGEMLEEGKDKATSFMETAGKILSTGWSGFTKTVKGVKDFGIKPLAKGLEFVVDKAKDPAKDMIGKLIGTSLSVANNLVSMGSKVITDHIPNAFKSISNFGTAVTEAMRDWVNSPKDIYTPGIDAPIMKAKLIEAGMYINKETGKVIEKMSDITGTVIDKAGNVVLDGSMIDNLYDKYGKKIKLEFKTLSKAAGQFFARHAFNALDKVKEGFGRVKDLASGMMGEAGEKLKGIKEIKLPVPAMQFIGNRTLNTIIQVRNILLRKLEGQKISINRGMVKEDSPVVKLPSMDKVKEDGKKLLDKIKGFFSKKEGEEDKLGLFGKLKKKALDVKDKLSGKVDEAKEAMGEDKTRSLGDIFKDKYRQLKDKAALKKEALTEDLKKKKEAAAEKAKEKKAEAEKRIEAGKAQLKEGSEKASAAFKENKAKAGAMIGSAFGFIKGKLLPGKGIAEETSESDKKEEKVDQPKESESEQPDPKPKKSLKDKIKDKFGSLKDNFSGEKKKFNDSDGDGDRDGNARDRIKEQDEKAKANKKDPLKADLKAKYGEKRGLDTLMKMASGLFGQLKDGLGSIIGGALNIFSGKGIGGMLGGLFKGLGGILKGGTGLMGKGLGAIGNVVSLASKIPGMGTIGSALGMVRNVATVTSLASGGAFGAMAGVTSTALTGLLAAVSSPVVLGAATVGALAYGGYRLYKYVTRNDADDYSRIRLYQYGLTDKDGYDRQYNSIVFSLEQYLLDGKIGYSGGEPYVNTRAVKPEEMLEIAKIDKEDTEAVEKFQTWFAKRFKPFFITHIAALYAVDGKAKFADIPKLPLEGRIKYLEACGNPGGPYNVDISPFKSLKELNVDPEYAKNAVANLLKKLQGELKGEKGKKPDLEKDKVASPPKVPENTPAKPPVIDQAGKTTTPALETQGEESEERKAVIPGGQKRLPSGRISMAEGPVREGEGADSYIVLDKGTKLDGMNPAMLRQLKGMIQEFGETTGEKVVVTSGTRTTAEQEALYRKDPTKAAKPGRSLHEFGLAVDIDSKTLNRMDEMGLMKKYGFTRPIGGEPWHVEAAGIQGNLKLMADNPTLASAAIASSLGKGGGGLGTVQGAPKGKRDTNYALKVAEIDPTMVRTNEEKDLAKKVMPAGATPSSPVAKLPGDKLDQLPAAPKSNPSVASKSNATSAPSGEGDGKVIGSVDAKTPKLASGKEDVKQQIKEAAIKSNGDPETLMTFGALESGLNPNARAKGTSAGGAFGFIDRTWNAELAKYGPKYGLDPNTPKTDIKASTYMASEYIKENEKAISKSVDDPGVADLYTAHFLGAGGANKLFSSPPGTRAAEILPQAAASNPAIFYKNGYALTNDELYQTLANKVEKKAKEFNIPLSKSEISGKSNLASGGNKTSASSATTATDTPSSTSTATQSASTIKVANKIQGDTPTVVKAPVTPSTPSSYSAPIPSPARNVDSSETSMNLFSKHLSKTNETLGQQVEWLQRIHEVLSKDIVNLLGQKPSGSNQEPQQSSPQGSFIKTNRQSDKLPSMGLDTRRGFST